MQRHFAPRWAGAFLAILSLLALSLAACGGSGGSSTPKEIIIATELPVGGTDASVGLPTQYGTDLAVSQNKDLGGGYTLSVLHDNYDGSSGPDGSIASGNVNRLVTNAKVMAVVGPFNSGIATVTMPITNAAGLVSISPSNTNPGLTKQQYAQENGINFGTLHPAGKPTAYFRIPGTDDVQGKVDAQIAAGAPINAKTVYVVDDNTTYGKGLANFFVSNFQSSGGTVVGRTSITAQQVSNVAQFADTIRSANPDAVFYGGITSGGGGALKKALVEKGYTKPLVGGDGIANDSSWLTTAGNGAANTFGTVAAPDTSALTSSAATKFISDYKAFVAGKPSNDLIPYSAMSYDAAMIAIQAIKNVIASGKPVTRAAVRDEVAKISYNGVTGQISFDANGDNSGPKVYAVYTVDSSNKWVYLKQVNG